MMQFTASMWFFGSLQPMPLDPQAHARFIGEVINLITGTIFVVIGLVALVVAAIRRRASGWRSVLWLGIWSTIYGVQRLNDCSFLVALLPQRMQVGIAYSHGLATYFVLVAGLLTFRELTVGRLRQIVTVLAGCAIAIGILGFGNFVLTGEEYSLIRWNTLIAVVGLVVLLVAFSIPRLNRQYGVVHDRGILLAGSMIFGAEALLTNLLRPFGYRFDSIWDSLGFARTSALVLRLRRPADRSSPASAACCRSRMNSPLRASCSSPSCPPPLRNCVTYVSRRCMNP